MNETNFVESGEKLLNEISDVLVDSSNDLVDVQETLSLLDLPQSRIIKQTIANVSNRLLKGNMLILQQTYKDDERDQYLDNLRGYFNEKTGTWYEQICGNFKMLTGFSANKWNALTWTIHLSLGHSTFDYLLHSGYISLDRRGKVVIDLRNAEVFGWDTERIQYLLDTDFQDLKTVTTND
ncbi:hypothetical protein [Enterococcus alishanensis]